MVTKAPVPCPNEANHTPHPAGYVAHSNWADDAMVVATQRQCPGCGLWAIWAPKRADLRIAVNWPPPTCDWGFCDNDAVAERFGPTIPTEVTEPAVELGAAGGEPTGRWLPVCRKHTGLRPRRPSPGRGPCSGCGTEYALTADGLVRAHDRGWERCIGSGRAPRATTEAQS